MWENTKDVFIQDQDSPLFKYSLMREDKSDITLTASVARDAMVIPVSSGHGFTTDDYISIFDVGGNYTQTKVVNVSLNDITISEPVANGFNIATTKIVRGRINQGVDGSSVNQIFKFTPYNFYNPIDISYICITMLHTSAGDYSTFGGIAALTDTTSYFLRKTDNIYFNYKSYKKNLDFQKIGADVSINTKVGGGQYSTIIIMDIKKIFGQVIRLNPILPDMFNAYIRADLTGLTEIETSLLGSFTSGE